MKRIVVVALTFFALGLLATAASAQVVTNPTKVEYTVSPDHAGLTKYIIGYFLPGATDPMQVADLPIVTPIAGKVEQPINATPLGWGTYIAKLKSVAGAVSSDWSLPSAAAWGWSYSGGYCA